jgi:hypothetical protein
MPSIRIIATPAGEAPEAIRRAWVGLVLPLHEKFDRPVTHPLFGVLTGPKTLLSMFFKNLFTTPARRDSYMVTAQVAIELLAKHNPTAAQWWVDNTPHFVKSTRWLLAFEPKVCELLP